MSIVCVDLFLISIYIYIHLYTFLSILITTHSDESYVYLLKSRLIAYSAGWMCHS